MGLGLSGAAQWGCGLRRATPPRRRSPACFVPMDAELRGCGQCELYHWVDLLDRFDGILAEAGRPVENMSWMLACDRPEREQLKALLLALLNFTALLIEYSFSRHLYSSIEHLTTLLASSDMQVVLAVLNLLYVFSKRSNYITRLGSDKRSPLLSRLQHLAESWGGKENGFGLAECCRDLHMLKYPPSATTLHFEFYAEPGVEVKVDKRATSTTLHYIHIEQLDKISESPSEIMESLTKMYSIPKDKQMLLFTHIRLAHGFSNHKKRLQAVQARLHAISILVYSNALQESANSILYNGLIEELVDVLQITDKQLMDIKAASLRTLTSIVHLERTPKLSSIIDCTGTASYHGFLPVLVRNCIQAMIDPSMEPYPHQFATALFSFLYHLASYDAGGEALVSCGMMEALLKVIKFLGDEQDQITFVTRAVRVVDLITNLDMAAFQSHSGLSIFIYRLEHEVDLCRRECPFVIKPKVQRPPAAALPEGEEMETDMEVTDVAMESSPGPSSETRQDPAPPANTATAVPSTSTTAASSPRGGVQCIPQRAALLKSMLNFLKKAIQDPAFSDGIRHVMDGSLPTSLKHIISNAEYYGPSLFLLATEVVTVFVFQEPSLLSSLQDNGLTDVMLHALLIKDVPATREVLGSLPNVFSALCLNARGLQSFVQCQPFERLFKVLLSPDYLPAMRRRRSSDPLGDTASNLGSAVDELMRHQPTLKTDATTAIIKLLEEICSLGRDPKYICQKPSMQKADGTAAAPPPRSPHAAEEASSEDEEEEEVQAMQSFSATQQSETEPSQQVVGTEERIPIPLMDYILNVMKFVESILSNNTTDDHCQEFVAQRGLRPLVTILGLPNLPVDFPTSAACQAVAGVCKSILTLSHEPKVLQEGLLQLEAVLSALEPLHRPIEAPGGSVLLRELAGAGSVPDATLSAQATPLLHALTAAHAYIMMFVHTCRVGQSEIRAISVNQWGSQLGLSVLGKLSQLYCSLVWESTVLLSLCTPNRAHTVDMRILYTPGRDMGHAAFTCIKQLWNRRPLKVYGGRMAESMLAILCHILRGEPLIRERLGREREGSRGEEETGGEEGGPRREPQVNQQQLQQLMDMGFSREHAMEALLNTNTMEQATEYLLTHPPPLMGGVVRDLSMSEEDQMMRAIAMSLGQDIPMDQRAESPEEAACRKEEEERRARERQEEEEAKCLEKFEGAEPLEAAELLAFTDSMLPGCSQLLDELPDTVYRVCDLIMTAVKRNGAAYRDSVLKQVVKQVWEAADVLIKAALPLTTSDTKTVSEWISQMATLPQASNLATRILLLTLLFEELKLPCARVVESSCVLDVLIKLLEVVQPCLQAAKEHKEVQTPKWITPVLLLIDFYEKTAVSSKRRAQMNKYLQATGNNWRWFDDRSGRWCSYSASNNSTIDAAWRAGETSVRFTAGRRRYTVQFTTMVQVNEETGNRRPVMLTLLRAPRSGKGGKDGAEGERASEEGRDPEGRGKEEPPAPEPTSEEEASAAPSSSSPSPSSTSPSPEDPSGWSEAPVRGLAEEAVPAVLRACVSMLGVPVDPDTLHATLRLCLRLTRHHKHALLFAELRSTRTILGLTQSSGFTGFTPLVTLLFRHIIEDPCTLRHTMEKVVRSAATSGAGSTTSGVVSGSLGSREVNYILRVLGPAACRSPNVFTEVATGCIRIALPAPRGSGTASDDEFENLRIKGPNAVQLVKTTPVKPAALPAIPDPIKDVIYDMLNALAAYHAPEEGDKGDPKSAAPSEVSQLLSDIGDDMYQQYRSLTRQPGDFDPPAGFAINAQVFAADGAAAETPPSGTPQGEAASPEEGREGRKEKDGERGEERQRAKGSKPLMPTSTILRLLAELVRSYVGIATLIANYSYTVGQSELIKEDCSVLAFVLDHLLPHTQNAEDKDTPALARLFLASLAAAGSGTDAQVALVNEVKAALGRALAMAESTEKHARLQAVMCIISTIMESCPSTSSFYSSATKTQHNGMNNIIRLFLKKGLVNDLARVPHSLDLSSPNMANTVNAALKPLETLSRIVNQPSGLFGTKGSSSKSKGEGAGGAREAGAAPPDGDSMNILDPEDEEEHTQEEDSSGSNEDEDDSQDEEEEEEEEDEDDQDDEEGEEGEEEEDDDDGSEMELDEDYPDMNASPLVRFERFDRDDDLIIEFDNMFSSPTDIPPSPGNIPASHPLLVRHADHGSLGLGTGAATTRLAQGLGRSQRTLRQLTANAGHTIHVHYPGARQPNPPLILQRGMATSPGGGARLGWVCLWQGRGLMLIKGCAAAFNPIVPELWGRRGLHGRGVAPGKGMSNGGAGQVLAQQRAEQQRRELAQATSSDAPMDPVTFIQTLPSELRRSVLEDMEDSVLAVMPPDIAAEAQALRREQEARQRQLMHERLFGHSSTSALSAILRSPAKSAKSPGPKGPEGGGGSGSADPRMAATGLTESQLQLSVEVLTSHSCSEEGLEDAANVLLQLSRGDAATRDTVLRLLLSGARQLGATLCRQIGTLLAELREYNLEQQRRAQSEAPSPEGLPEEQPPSAKLKGKMQSRFDTAESVVIVASQKRALGGRELQLPSMSVLTSKTSTQRFFLRVLQVIIQLRDDTRRAHKKAKQAGRLGAGGLGAAGSIQAAVRQLEAEADAIIQMVREGQRARRRQQADTVSTATHRTVLNQILRQSTTHLADGPFAVLVDYIRVLDFDVKRKYFRQELERLDEGLRKEDMAVHVRRDHVFEDSYRELHRKSPEEMKNRLYIVFEGEEGQDAGGLLREWYMIISREMFNPMYALFRTSPGDRVTYTINPSSHCNPNHLSYFKFVGRIVAKAVYDNRLLECYFTRSFYKHILGKSVRYTDMESEDYHFYQGLVYLLENDVSTLGYDLTFSTEVQEFGVCEVRDLKPNGANVLVTEENKKEYVHLVCQMRMTGAIRKQLAAFLEGFYEIIPKRLISIFTEQELELLISGLPTIDIDDLKANTEYHKYQGNSIQIQWFWRALRSFDQADRAKFLQFVTGTSKVPLQGFAALEGMNGIQKFQIHRDDRSTDRLPSAHTWYGALSELYGVPPCADPRQFLSHLARRQGRLRPGGLPDPHAAAVALLRDWTSGKISYYTHPPETQGVQLEAQILTTLGPALDLEALERGDAEALAAVPVTVTGIGLSPCVPEAEEEEEKAGGEEEVAMEDDDGDLELGTVTVELKPRVKTAGSGEGSAPRAPRLEEVAALHPLLQGQGLRAASKRRKKLQKRAEKIATKLSETLEAAMQF
ncbi:PREDICTED: E3 ubiquitin-protein ligase HUWE1 [Haliaeetus leucocephalus]|uniref:E3 ubiquitin-protein ligase HUWE1 n=2 Tax=Telluraves TaxID=3073808 RepID=UPI00053CE7A8|nr:PREDICTED: E3 ubiquitin-protein ligase HUWE1 [Haliaeetus leucocephalus]